jgi:hypothetical protein
MYIKYQCIFLDETFEEKLFREELSGNNRSGKNFSGRNVFGKNCSWEELLVGTFVGKELSEKELIMYECMTQRTLFSIKLYQTL